MEVIPNKPVRSVAIVGADYPGLRPALKVAEGDIVQAGQTLLTDRAHPRVALVAPIAGKVVSVDYGPRRSLSALVLHREEKPADKPKKTAPPDMTTRATLRDALLARGIWPTLRTRPFGRFPDPDKTPDAIFVIATDSAPLAPDPRAYLIGQELSFSTGVCLMALLTDGPVHVCQSSGPRLVKETPRIRNVIFDGPHPAGLASTHIQTLHPVGYGQEVWTIDCQDVAAIGHLAETGHYDPARVIAVTNPRTSGSQLIRTLPGALLSEIAGENPHIHSGSPLSGLETNWLGRFHRQVTIGNLEQRPQWPYWLKRLMMRKVDETLRAIIPTAALERALPPNILPVPLMRALSVRDTDAAARLGALSLIEEDMDLLTSLCTSGANYGKLLRQVLNELEQST